MPTTPERLTVNPSGRTTVVTLTNSYGDAAVAYDSEGGDSEVTFPDTITSATTYFMTDGGDYTVSAAVGDVECAGAGNATATVSARAGVPVTVITPHSVDELVSSLIDAVRLTVADHETRITALETP